MMVIASPLVAYFCDIVGSPRTQATANCGCSGRSVEVEMKATLEAAWAVSGMRKTQSVCSRSRTNRCLGEPRCMQVADYQLDIGGNLRAGFGQTGLEIEPMDKAGSGQFIQYSLEPAWRWRDVAYAVCPRRRGVRFCIKITSWDSALHVDSMVIEREIRKSRFTSQTERENRVWRRLDDNELTVDSEWGLFWRSVGQTMRSRGTRETWYAHARILKVGARSPHGHGKAAV